MALTKFVRRVQSWDLPSMITILGHTCDPALAVVEKSPGAETEEVAKRAPDPPAEVPTIKELMDERAGAEDVGSEEDDIDVQGKFFVAINVRNRHRKMAQNRQPGRLPDSAWWRVQDGLSARDRASLVTACSRYSLATQVRTVACCFQPILISG